MALPSSVSNRYSLSIRTQGSSCRCCATSSPRRVSSFSAWSSSSRAASHSSRVPVLRSVIASSLVSTSPRTNASTMPYPVSPAVGSITRGHWGRLALDLLLRDAARPTQEQKSERDADPGEDRDGEEGRLEALCECDQPIRPPVRRQVVLCARHRHRGDDGHADCRPDLEARVAETGREPGLALWDAGQRRDRGGHEGEADSGPEDEQPEEDVPEVAAADRNLGEEQRTSAHQRHPDRGDRSEADA